MDNSLDAFFHFFTWLGNWEQVILLLVGCLFFFLHQRWQRDAVILLLSVVVAKGMEVLLKRLLAWERPDATLWLTDATGYSFPSGHTTVATAFYGALVLLLWPHCQTKKKRALLLGAALFMILAISFSRLYLSVHWPADILGGWIVGGLVLLAVLWVQYKMRG